MRQITSLIFVYLLCLVQKFVGSNPINAFPPHMLTGHAGFIHPAMLPLYPLQYPTFPMQQLGASSLEELQQANNAQGYSGVPMTTGNANNINGNTASKDASKNDEEDDDANKRDDEDTFWESLSSYGKNRWTNFRDGFTELYDVFRAAGRGFKGIFTLGE